MADEQLRMRALVVDNATGPLQRISREVRALASQRVDQLGRQFDSVRSRLAPIEGGINGIGLSLIRLAGPIGAVAAVTAGALYAAGKKINDFARDTRALDDFAKATGFSISQVEKFSQVMGRLDIDRQQAQAGLGQFAGNLFKFRTRTAGELNKFLRDGGASDLADKLSDLAGKGENEKALAAATDYIAKLDKIDPQKAALLAQALFGDANFRKLSDYNEQLQKSGSIIERNVEAAKKWRDEMNNLTEKADRLQSALGNKGLTSGAGVLGLLNNKEITGDNDSPVNQKQAEIQSRAELLKEVERRMGQTRTGSVEYNRLAEQRDKLTREIGELVEGLRKLSDEVDRNVKKMSFQGSGGGSGSMVIPASYTGGGAGGGIQGFRAGGFRGGPVGIGAMGSQGGGSEGGGDTGAGTGAEAKAPPGGGSLPGINKSIRDAQGAGSGGGPRSVAMAAAMDQLRKEGVPEGNLKHAAAALTGQAIAESNLNPNTSHDGGTGFGIYGARNERASKMMSWLKENGHEKNSLEGQMKYMAHEAMNDKTYAASREALMGANGDNIGGVNRTLTRNFERPAVNNFDDRLRATMGALNVDGTADPGGVKELQDRVAAIRKGKLATDLKEQLAYASSQTGLEAEVTSGGQPSSGPNRTGSHRHDHGGAGDLRLRDPKSGELMDMRNPEHQGRMSEFVKASVRAGARGVGAGLGYMGPNTVHIGGGSTAAWGGAPWVKDALRGGLAEKPVDLSEWRAKMDKAQGNEMSAKVEGTGKLTVDVNGPKGTRVGAEGGGLFRDVQINRSTQMMPAAEGPSEDLTR